VINTGWNKKTFGIKKPLTYCKRIKLVEVLIAPAMERYKENKNWRICKNE
jgi:hypothetical protein